MAIDPKKHAMPTQEAKVRARNFQEVALGYSEEIAVAEAQRCLNCKNQPCVTGCPVNIRIPEFISKIKAGDFEGAYQTISVTSSLPAVCGRVCPQEKQCESKCTLGIKFEPVGIGRLERFAADWHNEHSTITPAAAPKNGFSLCSSPPTGAIKSALILQPVSAAARQIACTSIYISVEEVMPKRRDSASASCVAQ